MQTSWLISYIVHLMSLFCVEAMWLMVTNRMYGTERENIAAAESPHAGCDVTCTANPAAVSGIS